MKKLLIEHFPLEITKKTLTESANKMGGPLILEGIIQRANAKNHNGRVYPKDILEREIQTYIEGPVTEKRAYGELDHPESQVINLKNVSHNILEIWWDGDDVKAKLQILPTPSGDIAKALIQSGCSLGISSRAMGSVQNLDENTVEVQDDLSLVGWDLVSEPSTHQAFVKEVGGLNESISKKQPGKYHQINEIISDIICSHTGVCCLN
jgi:hypothetical protein